MDVLLVNAIVYVITLLVLLWKEHKFNIYILIWASYTLLAIFGYVSVIFGYHYSHDVGLGYKISFVPYVCVYITVFIISQPFKDFNSKRIDFSSGKIDRLRYIVYFSFPVFLIYGATQVYKAVIVSNIGFGEAYAANFAGESLFQFDNSFLNFVDKWGNLYTFTMLAFMVTFFLVRLKNRIGSNFVNIVCTLFCFLPSIANSLVRGSKGSLFFIAFDLIFYYMIFSPIISEKVKKYLLVSGITICTIFMLFVLQITSGRIETGRTQQTTEGVIIMYLGEAMPNLGWFYYDKNCNHLYGERFFPELYGIQIDSRDHENANYYWNKRTKLHLEKFKTLWGDCYVEFGVIGSFIFLILFSFLWKFFVFNNFKHLFVLPLIAYYFKNFVIFGLFDFSFKGSTIHIKFLFLILGCLFIKLILNRSSHKQQALNIIK